MIKKAKEYAINMHALTAHRYDGKPYDLHLQMVVNVAYKFLHLIPEESRETVIAGCWVHDVIEDCRETYNDVKSNTNENVAELAYALTNEKGKNRSERANDKYYKGINSIPFANFIKICDRIANYQYSKQTGSKMAELYKKEMSSFTGVLYKHEYDEMFDYLINLQ